MSDRRIPWGEGTWTTPPVEVNPDGDRLLVTALEGSDYWERTVYGFQHDNGHALLADWDRAAGVEVTFRLDGFSGLYDQAGLFLWHGPTQWVKAGVELNDGVPQVGAVVTDTYSDWSLAEVPEWAGREITIRASRIGDGVVLRARADADPWRLIRVARFDHSGPCQAGPFTCAPSRSGLTVTFTRWATTAPDRELHADPPTASV